MQSTLDNKNHVAIVMDGNRRWSRARGGPPAMGHAAGAKALRAIVEAAPAHGITALTVYAFSSDNWRRPPEETGALMALLKDYLDSQTEALVANGVRFSVIGRRDRLSPELVVEIERTEAVTAWGDAMQLRLAIDYSARDAILNAARQAAMDCTREQFAASLMPDSGAPDAAAGDVDLLIRTGNEQRLSDFLLWECAYAELYFTPCLWPDFGVEELAAALREFRGRDRRFGGASHPEQKRVA